MIGPYLAQRGLACAAFSYARNGFTDPEQETEDLAGAEAAMQLVAHFGVPLSLGGPSSPAPANREAKLAQAVRFRRARERGVNLSVHPHSHHTSLVLTAPEYN